MNSNTILCVGYARLPEGTTMAVLYKVFGLGLEIETESSIIVRAQTTSVTGLGNDFLTKFFINKNVETDFKDILEQISRNYRAPGSKAILAAAQKAYNEYLSYKKEVNQKPNLNPKIDNVHTLVTKTHFSCRDWFIEKGWVMEDC